MIREPGLGRVPCVRAVGRGRRMRGAAAFATIGAFSVPPGPWLLACAPAAIVPSQTRMSPMLETNPIHHLIKDLSERTDVLRGYL